MNSKDQKIVNTDRTKLFWQSNQQVFRELLTFVDFADQKLNIGFAEVNFAGDRDLVIQNLIGHPNCQDIQFAVLDFPDPDLRFLRDEIVTALDRIKINPEQKLVLLATGLEKSIGVLGEYPDVLVNLNYVRDDFRKNICHPIIFFLPDYALTRLAKYAPDFWAWGRKVFYFKSVKSGLETIRDSAIYVENSDSLNLSEKKSRIDLLQRLLSEYKSTNKVEKKHDLITVSSIYSELGNAYGFLGEYQRAIDFHEQSLKIKQQIGNKIREAYSLNDLGNAYFHLGKYQNAIDFYRQSLKIKQQIGDKDGEANSLMGLGNAHDSLGRHQSAIDFYQQSLKIQQQIGDKNGEAYSLDNLGVACNSLREHQRAIDLSQQSLEIKQQIGDKNGEANSLNNLGNAYLYLGKYQKAIDSHQKSLDIRRQIGNRYGEARSLGNLGSAYLCLGEYQRAIDFHEQSLKIKQQIGDKNGEANSWFNLGNAQKELKQYLEAKEAYESAKKIYQIIGLTKQVNDCNEEIQDINIVS